MMQRIRSSRLRTVGTQHPVVFIAFLICMATDMYILLDSMHRQLYGQEALASGNRHLQSVCMHTRHMGRKQLPVLHGIEWVRHRGHCLSSSKLTQSLSSTSSETCLPGRD